ncbi:hypothetical protein TYRP_014292 [Tyrophagus putrescentiae]|nr:hypothetical protein TYRP_014292 [Tyrophagus putrescentiae]
MRANRQFPANRTSANTLMVLLLQSLPIVVVAAVVGNFISGCVCLADFCSSASINSVLKA